MSGPFEGIGKKLYVHIGAPVALFCMAAIFACGLAYVLVAVYISLTGNYHHGIDYLLKGIELLFLAPLAYLVFGTTVTLVVSLRRRLVSLNTASTDTVASHLGRRLEETFHVVHRVKQSVAGLFVALLLTDLIGKVLNRDQLSWIELAAEMGALVIGLIYYSVQMQCSLHDRENIADGSPQPKQVSGKGATDDAETPSDSVTGS